MKTEWSLDEIYKGFDDPAFLMDVENYRKTVEEFCRLPETFNEGSTAEVLERIIKVKEEEMERRFKLLSYCELVRSADTGNAAASSYEETIMMLSSNKAKAYTQCEKFIAETEDIESVIKGTSLEDCEFALKFIKESSRYSLSADVEEVIAKLNITGGNAWSNLQSALTSNLKADMDGKEYTLSAIRNMAYSHSADVRKKAYEAELASYEKIKESVAFALNNIKAQVNTVTELRGFESPLEETLFSSWMSKKTLDAMFEAIDESLPKLHQYLRRKGEILGNKDGLPWYDLFAPAGKSDKTYTLEEAREYLVSHFSTFSTELTDMINKAFDKEWIDFLPREGKVGGAFCYGLPYIRQSRILTNFDGSFSDIVTLAHELGHAFHNEQIFDHRAMNSDYSMPVAETASTFNEVVIMEAAISEASGDEKMALVENQLSDAAQIICDIYSRYLFETEVFEKRKTEFIPAEELCNIMLSSQKKTYGNGLDHKYLHKYMWICKGHYYSSTQSFYNFPYAFGGLFARGLYAKYREEGESFVEKYKALLHATTVGTAEQTAALVGIDLTDKNFWKSALKLIEDKVDIFLELTKNQ